MSAEASSKPASKTKKPASPKAPKPSKPSLEDLRAQLTGTWRLMSAEDQDSQTKKWIPYTFGNPPSGYFIYDASGYASVQIMPTPPVAVTAPDPTQGGTQQFVNEFLSYYGPWTIDESYVTVMAEGNLDPTGVKKPQKRPYTLNGDTLTIGSKAEGYIRTLQRVR